jgi:hypothetical protein
MLQLQQIFKWNFPTEAPTEVEAVIASKSRENAKRQLDREFDTNYLSSNEAHLFRKRL